VKELKMIKLSKNEIRYNNHYNLDCDEYIEKAVDSLVPYLKEDIELSIDFTLKDLFVIIEKEVDNYNLIFSSYLGHHPLSLFIEDINKKSTENTDDMEYLELQWIANCDYFKKSRSWTGEETKDIDFYADFHGWGTWDDSESPTMGGIAIEYCSLSWIKDLPIKLKTNTKIILDDGTYEKDKNGKFQNKVLFEGEKTFSVFEFISTILYEISWGGGPEQRDKHLEEIMETKKDIDKKYESGDHSSFKSLEEIKKDKK
jgi:hypothetical protein